VGVSGITSGAVSMATGYSHSCAMLTGNVLKCWGSNSDGQLGNGDVLYSTTPSVITFASAAYIYGDSAHKHAVTALSTGESYSYGATGNMTCRVENGITYKQEYNAENLLSAVYKMNGNCTTGTVVETTSFVYDGDGTLVKKINPNGSKTLYVGGIYEVDKNSSGIETGTKTYYPAGGAMRITTVSPPSNNLYYVLKAQLGSASVLTDINGNTITGADTRYYPFGEARFSTSLMLTDKLFTGQREITGLGIYNYGARFYSQKLGRFLSADTITVNPANPQKLNHFSYAVNNPLRYTDPTGHRACDNVDAAGNCITEPGGGGMGFGGLHPKKPKHGGGGGSGTPPPGHAYDTTPHAVCLDLPWISCSDEEVADYLSHWQYPGQFFWQPVENSHRYNVFPAYIGTIQTPIGYFWPGSGAILVQFDTHSITNVTLKSHVFYEGYVNRTWYRDENGVPYVTTHGEGTNNGFGVVTIPIKNVQTNLISVPGPTIDEANQNVGPYVFDALDVGLVTYTTIVETEQYISNVVFSPWP